MITKLDEQFIRDLAEDGRRQDDREPEERRELEIETGYAKNAEGSALVTLGDTRVLVGVKMSTGEPFPDSPDEGVLMVGAELAPKASPEFEVGPPREHAAELARVTDRAIREAETLDIEDLVIEPGEKVWMVQVDIDILNDAGNLFDASGIAAFAALSDTTIPELDDDTEEPVFGTEQGEMEINNVPVPVTVYKIGDALFFDADYEEEEAADARLTVASTDDFICSMQKGGSGNFKTDELYTAVDMAYNEADDLREEVREQLNL